MISTRSIVKLPCLGSRGPPSGLRNGSGHPLGGVAVAGRTDGASVSLPISVWLRFGGEVALDRAVPAAPSPRGRDRTSSSSRHRARGRGPSPRRLSPSDSSPSPICWWCVYSSILCLRSSESKSGLAGVLREVQAPLQRRVKESRSPIWSQTRVVTVDKLHVLGPTF